MVPANQFLRDNAYTRPPGGWEITYRQTPAGQPTVAELLQDGDEIEVKRSMCGRAHTDIFVCGGVRGPFTYADPGQEFPWFSVQLRDPAGKQAGHINECVAVDGVVRGLFDANDLEIRAIGRAAVVARPRSKPQQLSLF